MLDPSVITNDIFITTTIFFLNLHHHATSDADSFRQKKIVKFWEKL
jgi:hypothetical protein